MNKRHKEKYAAMSLKTLRELRDDLSEIIREQEAQPRREIDIAAEHTGDPALIARVLRTVGDPNSGRWHQVERIYCTFERCPRCPHGDFRYRYQRNKRKGTITVDYVGTQVFDHELIERLKARIGIE